MKAREWSALAALFVVAVFLLPGCSGKGDSDSNKNEKEKKGNVGGDKKGSDSGDTGGADMKPDFSMSMEEFDKEYSKDAMAAEAKYRDKVVELTGTITVVGLDAFKRPALISGFTVCETADKEPWQKVIPGQTVKLKGKFATFQRFESCVILEVSGPVPPTLTADELGKEVTTNKAATFEKYYDKLLFLRGEIAQIALDKEKATQIILKTGDKSKVFVAFQDGSKAGVEGLKTGQKIKVLGKFTGHFPKPEVGVWGDPHYLSVEESK